MLCHVIFYVKLCILLLILCIIVYNIKGEKNASTKENN